MVFGGGGGGGAHLKMDPGSLRNPEGGVRVDIQQACSPPPPIVLIGEQEIYSGLK